tara:strand:- start:6871 stop:9210 length:2340 start_codon:yes stop_codon:yes gene_type:complete
MDELTAKNIYDAYKAGRMTADEAAEYKKDVNGGSIPLPAGATLGDAAPAAPATQESNVLNPGIAAAYKSGQMTPQETADLEADISSGKWVMPANEEPGLAAKAADIVTGDLRRTDTTDSLPDWGAMPEMNSFSVASAVSALGTFLTSPEETVQVIQSNFPGTQMRQDDKGNFIMTSSIDGKEYAIKPGFQPSDIPRAAAGLMSFTPAGKAGSLVGAAGAAAGTQLAIEGTQAAAGGSFDAEQVPIAAGLGVAGAGLGKVASAAMNKAPVPTAPALQTPTELAASATTASGGGMGSERAARVLATQSAPDPKVVEAAERLGVSEYLQPDHVSTNQAYRELAQAVKSMPGSHARAQEMSGLDELARKADDVILELGGSLDLSNLDRGVKTRIKEVQSGLYDEAEKMYGDLREAIKPNTPAPATNTVEWIKNRAAELGGEEYLSPLEAKVLRSMSTDTAPTYARLDDLRKNLTVARIKKEGVFKDADSGMIKKLEKLLLTDQKVVADEAGVAELFDTARKTVAVRKGVEDDMTALFGRDLEGSLLNSLKTSVVSLSKGDVSKFTKLLKAVPEDMREEVAASGLNTAFGKSARDGKLNFTSYAKWYESLLANKQAHTALMSNLPPASRKRLSDLYRVSNGVRKATKERITTGRIQAVRDDLKGADNLIANIYSIAKRSAAGASAEAITTPLGIPGAGLAAGIASAMVKGRPDVIKATDALIASPEFISMAASGDKKAAEQLMKTGPWKKFYNAVGGVREIPEPAQWLLKSSQAARQTNEDEQQ